MFASSEVTQKLQKTWLLIDIWGGVPSLYFLIAQQVTRLLNHVWKWQHLYPAVVLNITFFLGFSASLTKIVLRAVCQAHKTVGVALREVLGIWKHTPALQEHKESQDGPRRRCPLCLQLSPELLKGRTGDLCLITHRTLAAWYQPLTSARVPNRNSQRCSSWPCKWENRTPPAMWLRETTGFFYYYYFIFIYKKIKLEIVLDFSSYSVGVWLLLHTGGWG